MVVDEGRNTLKEPLWLPVVPRLLSAGFVASVYIMIPAWKWGVNKESVNAKSLYNGCVFRFPISWISLLGMILLEYAPTYSRIEGDQLEQMSHRPGLAVT